NFLIVQGQLWRLFTPMFLHGGFVHLGVNSYSLYLIGPRVERSFGHFRFLAIYVLSGVAGSVVSFALGPYQSIGASGALFGLIGALVPMLYLNRKIFANTRQQIANIIIVIGLNLFYGFSAGGIDNWAHIGGLVSGLALAWPTAPRYVLRLSTMDTVRLDDESSISIAWLVYSLSALGLGLLTFLLINLRLLATIP
ncbi:MAG: rhomboid family intramembrane serine protease, partial [Anaerolineae bacterium]|nr:rhomboid family intramembrane serine protease [Anaerolineae bacterium]